MRILYELDHIFSYIEKEECLNNHYVCLEKGWVDDLFQYFARQGDIYNTGIKVIKIKLQGLK